MTVGVDLLDPGELDRLVRRSWFRRFAYTEAELGHADTLAADRRREFLAGRFAAKEAVLKVLGLGFFQGVRPAQVEVVRDPSGAPAIRLHGAARLAARRRRLGAISISLSHKKNLVVAIALGHPLTDPGDWS